MVASLLKFSSSGLHMKRILSHCQGIAVILFFFSSFWEFATFCLNPLDVTIRYCLAGTIGHKLMSAKIPTQIKLDEDVKIDVRCQVLTLPPLMIILLFSLGCICFGFVSCEI